MAGESEKWVMQAEYRQSATLGFIFKDQQAGTIPLKLYFSDELADNATMAGEAELWAISAGYGLAATLGYINPNTSSDVAVSVDSADSGRSRSRFRTDGDHRSEVMAITNPA